jgi:hypothetical protein
MKKLTKTLRQDSQGSSRNLNKAIPKYTSKVLLLHQPAQSCIPRLVFSYVLNLTYSVPPSFQPSTEKL